MMLANFDFSRIVFQTFVARHRLFWKESRTNSLPVPYPLETKTLSELIAIGAVTCGCPPRHGYCQSTLPVSSSWPAIVSLKVTICGFIPRKLMRMGELQ